MFRASCNFIAMFQVVVSYLESRFACFFTEKPFSVYEELLQKIKEVVPYTGNIPSERIRVVYKDINLSTNRESDEGIFINISPGESLILNEAFRNAYDCGSESFKRVHIKIREIDSPFIAKVNDNENANVGRATSSKELAQSGPRVELKSRKKLGFQTVETKPTVVEDWKNNKEKDITSQIADLQSELYAVEAQLEEMNRPIMEQPHSRQYKTIVCRNCHVRGHRSEGNKNNAPCLEEPCYSYIRCGQKKKHPEHFEEIRTLTKRCKQLKQEIEILKQDKQNLVAFESKSISAFTTAVTNRLIKAFPDRYNLRSAIGKIKLQKDIVTIRLACNDKIPIFTTVGDDRNQFLKLLEEQQNRFDEIDNTDIVKRGYRENAGTSTYISNDNSPNFTNINKISLPVKVKKSKKNRRRKYSSSSSSDNDSSSSSSSSDEGERRHDECISRRKHRGAGKKKRKYRKSRRHNSPSHAKKLHVMEGAVPSDNGICNAQREGTSAGTVPVGTIYDESNIINETNIDKNSGILSASTSETCSLDYLANVAKLENLAKLE